ncbi:MAG: PKD domain-containing protein, partial [Planctomycetota bacterium]
DTGDAVNLAPPLDHTEQKDGYADHKPGYGIPLTAGCTLCHGPNLDDGFAVSCYTCHERIWAGEGPPLDHSDIASHKPGFDDPWGAGDCTACHGSNLEGRYGGAIPACSDCHNPFADPDPPPPGHHGGDRDDPYADCAACHGQDLQGAPFGPITAPSCNLCHVDLWAVGNQPPVPDAGGPYEGTVGEAVVFDASGTTDREGNLLSFTWDFGDGRPPLPSMQYPVTAYTFYETVTYNGTLTVEDGFNAAVVVPFTVQIGEARPGPDVWTVTTTAAVPETFTITIEDHTGFLVITKDDGMNLPSLAFGIEFVGVIFWMDIWMDLSGNVFWGTGDMYFGNINRVAGTMAGVVFEDTGGVVTFSGTKP